MRSFDRKTQLSPRRVGVTGLLTLAIMCCVLLSCGPRTTIPTSSPANPRTVRVVYLVSSDREERPEYTRAIDAAVRDLQQWYAGQLGGATFTINARGVEVVRSNKAAAWFYDNPNGTRPDDWGYNNTLAEAARLLGARKWDPDTVWVIYSDGPGSSGRAGAGVACLPEDDLLGLVGRHPTQPDTRRWVAGLGHELGHALGLPHPEDTIRDANAIMWTGIYGMYPDRTYLTERDKLQLWRSPFISPMPPSKLLLTLRYARGSFERRQMASQTYWIERDASGEPRYTFREVRSGGGKVLAHDRGRGFTLELPLGAGPSRISTDGGTTWSRLYDLKR